MKSISEMINESIDNAKKNVHNMIQIQDKEIETCIECISAHLIKGDPWKDIYNLRQKFTYLGACKTTKQTMIEFFEGVFGQTYDQYVKEMKEESEVAAQEAKDNNG